MHAQIEVEDLAMIKGNESNIMSEETYDQQLNGKSEASLTSLNTQSTTNGSPQKQQQQNKGGQQGGGDQQNKMNNRNKNKNNNNNKFVKKPPHMQNQQQQQQHNGFHNQNGGNKFNKLKNNNNNMMGGMMGVHGQQNSQHQFMAHMANAIPAHERKFTGRCRLFVGNLPAEMTEAEFKEMFVKYGEIGEVFINTQRSFGFIKLDTRINAEHARQELDGHTVKGRCLRVRFASHGAAVKVKNLSPHVSNEYLESAFAQFGPVERAVVMVDDKGKPTGEGLVEFERKSSAQQCISRCSEHPFILTNYPRPIVVESYEQVDDEDGLPEKSMTKNPQFYAERETLPRFAKPGTFEFEVAQKWHDFYEQEKQINEEARQKIEQAKEMLEYEIQQRLVDYKASVLKEDLQRKQEELLRLEEMRKGDFQRRKEQMDQFRRQDDDQRRNATTTNNNNMDMKNPMGRGLFDQGALLSQPLQQPILSNAPANAGSLNAGNRQQQLAMAQQQAILTAHLSALAAAAQQQHQQQMQYGGGNYDNGGGYDNGQNNNHHGGNNKSKRDDYRDDRQQRGNNNQLGGKRSMSNANQGGMSNRNNNNNQRGGYDGSKRARY